MKMLRVVGVAVAWAASLWAVGAWAQGGRGANVEPAPGILQGRPNGPVISGENFGFQPIVGPRTRDGRVVGKIMVRLNGDWVEIASAVSLIKADAP